MKIKSVLQQREARTAGEDTSPAIAHTLGTTPRSALEANLKLADGCDSLLKEAQVCINPQPAFSFRNARLPVLTDWPR